MGLFHLGTNGETPSLCHRLKKEIMNIALEQVEKKVQVLVGITDTSFAESINIAEYAAKKRCKCCCFGTAILFSCG